MTDRRQLPDLELKVGVDIVEISRFRTVKENSRFLKRNFTERELEYCHGFDDPAPHLAATFAGKEAVLKAICLDLGLSFKSVEIMRGENGAPEAVFPGMENYTTAISLSHSTYNAVAIALALDSQNIQIGNTLRKMLDDSVQELALKSDVVWEK
jgi:holo-[acyl-carrier protein] synthase